MITINSINPNYKTFEGFAYLEFEGEFYKGCKRCGGEGHYSHNGEHSRCYTCNNTSAKLGEKFSSEDEAQKWCHSKALRRAAAQRKRDAEYAALLAKQDQKLAAIPEEVRLFLQAINLNAYPEDKDFEKSSFIQDMAKHVQYPAMAEKSFTEKMAASVAKVMLARMDRAEVDAARPPVPTEGRVTITGTILSCKIVEGDYGTAYKIVVEDDRGFKTYGSLPKAQADEAYETFSAWLKSKDLDWFGFGSGVWFIGDVNGDFPGVKGRRIRFDAAITASNDDKSFGFASRPTKGAWL